MTGIIPDAVNGGLPVRDSSGAPIVQPTVQNAYVPPPSFRTSCTLNYLPSDCNARIVPAQINAFQSEMLCLAASLDPDGMWNCADLCNLSAAFQSWTTDTLPNLVESFLCGAPFEEYQGHTVIGCGINGLATLNAASIVGDVACASPEEEPDGDTRLLACDGDGKLIKINPSGLNNCYCPPAEGAAPPTAAPSTDGSAYYVDTTDPNNRILYYWDGAAWRKINGSDFWAIETRTQATTTRIPASVNAFMTFGYSAVGDGGGARYKRSATQPWHAGKVQSADGAWWEMIPDTQVRPEQFGAFGADPSVAVASMPNDTTGIQAMFNFVGFTGVGCYFRGGRRFKIMQTIFVRVTRQQTAPLPLSSDIFFSDKSSIDINGTGTGQIVAGAAMADMLVFQYNSNAVNGVTNVRGPDGSKIRGFILNGNNLAVNGLRADFTRNVHISDNSIFGTTTSSISWTGSGVTSIADNNLKATECISCKAGSGGDLFIGHNQYFFPLTGGAAVRIENGGNIFIDGGTVNGEGIANVLGVYITTTAGNTCRHVKVENMEWSGCQAGVYVRGNSTNDRIYGLILGNNHVTSSAGVDRPAINPGLICDLQYVDEFHITTNIGNGRALLPATETGIITRDCRDGTINDQSIVNYNGPAWYARNCTNVHWDGGIVRDVGKAGASGLIVDFDNCQDCSFNPKNVTQTSASYAQNGIFERTGSNRNTSDRVVWSGVSTPSVRVGANSRFRRYPKPFVEAQVSQNGTTATLQGGYNVASVARASVGRCQVNFTEAHLAGANYVANATGAGCIAQIESPATNSIVVLMTNLAGNPVDGSFYLSIESLA